MVTYANLALHLCLLCRGRLCVRSTRNLRRKRTRGESGTRALAHDSPGGLANEQPHACCVEYVDTPRDLA